MRHCGHADHTPGCNTCRRCETDPRYARYSAKRAMRYGVTKSGRVRPPLVSKNALFHGGGTGSTTVPAAPKKARVVVPLPCVLRGDPTGETRPCSTCTGPVAVPLVGCQVFGACTTAKLVTDAEGKPVACCAICTARAETQTARVT